MNLFDVLFAKKLSGGDSPFPPVIKRVTGNPIEFEDGADAPLVKCTTAITGSQDLHGYDKPWVGGANINKMPPLTNGTYTSNGLTATVTDNSITVTGQYTTAQATWVDIPFVSAVTIPSGYYLHIRNSEIHANTVLDFDSQANILLSEQNRIVSISALTSCTKIRFFCNANATEQFNLTMQLSIEQTNSVTEWTSYSNICPITAYSSGTVEIRGRNIFDGNNILQDIYINTSGMKISNIGATGASAYCEINGGTTYTITKMQSARFIVATTTDLPANNVTINDYRADYSATQITIPTTSSDNYLVVFFYLASADTGKTQQQILDTIMVEEGSVAHGYEPYVKNDYIATFSNSIYQGNADFVGGGATATYGYDDLSGKSWAKVALSTKDIFYTPISSLVSFPKYTYNIVPNAISSVAVATKQQADVWNVGEFVFTTSSGTLPFQSLGFIVEKNLYADATAFDAFISGKGIAFELATPTTETITPTKLPLKSLFGYNHIESSTGDMVVDYITDAYQNFVDTVESALPNTTRNLLTASKGGVKAFDIFKTLDEPKTPEAPAEESKPEEKETEEGAKK